MGELVTRVSCATIYHRAKGRPPELSRMSWHLLKEIAFWGWIAFVLLGIAFAVIAKERDERRLRREGWKLVRRDMTGRTWWRR